jgi:hypothetical protein
MPCTICSSSIGSYDFVELVLLLPRVETIQNWRFRLPMPVLVRTPDGRKHAKETVFGLSDVSDSEAQAFPQIWRARLSPSKTLGGATNSRRRTFRHGFFLNTTKKGTIAKSSCSGRNRRVSDVKDVVPENNPPRHVFSGGCDRVKVARPGSFLLPTQWYSKWSWTCSLHDEFATNGPAVAYHLCCPRDGTRPD